MAELDMLADIKQMAYPEEVTQQLQVMAQARESSPVIERRSDHCATFSYGKFEDEIWRESARSEGMCFSTSKHYISERGKIKPR